MITQVNEGFGSSAMTLKSIAQLLNGEFLGSEESLAEPIEYISCSDLMSEVLAYSVPDAVLVTGLCTAQTVRTAAISDSKAIIYVFGQKPSPNTLKLAKELSLSIIITTKGAFEVCAILQNNGLKRIC